MVGALELKARLHVDVKMGPNWDDMRRLSLPGVEPQVSPVDDTDDIDDELDAIPDALQRA
jgi:hypothetical protein